MGKAEINKELRERNYQLFNSLQEQFINIVQYFDGNIMYEFVNHIIQKFSNLRTATTNFLIFKDDNIGDTSGKQVKVNLYTISFIRNVLEEIYENIDNHEYLRELIISLKPQNEIIYNFANRYKEENGNIGFILDGITKTIHVIFNLNIQLAQSVANKYRVSHIPFNDILQSAYTGLQFAILKYYPSNIEFSTYAYNWISQHIIETIVSENTLHIDNKGMQTYRNVKKKINLFRENQLQEIEEYMKRQAIQSLNSEEKALVYAMFPHRFDEPIYENKDGDVITMEDRLGYESEDFDHVERRLILQNLIDQLEDILSKEEIISLCVHCNLIDLIGDYISQRYGIHRFNPNVPQKTIERIRKKILSNDKREVIKDMLSYVY